ncbi:MAG: EAL domain-containing protein, partial [Gammaproteobacteria bacterium]
RFKWEHQRFRVSLAAAVLPISADSSDAEAMLTEAAKACKAARESGASRRVHVYQASTKKIEGAASPVEDWGRWLAQALSTQRLPLYIQPVLPVIQRTAFAPIYALSAGSEDHRILYPSCLAGPPEETLQAFDRLLIREVLFWMANNQNAVIESECCGIHLGEYSVRDPKLLEHVLGLFSEIAVPPGKVCFQIPHAVAEKHFVQTERFVLTMKEFGCRFALDDFEGPSGSGYLDRLPVDYLAMSGALVQGLTQNPNDKALVQSINGIGHMIGKRTIAKGVRDEALLAGVRSIGVDYAQGMEPTQALGDFKP